MSVTTFDSTGFFISIELPNTAGDTIAIYTSAKDELFINNAWEKLSLWRKYSQTSGPWYFGGTHYIAPILCRWPLGVNEARNESILYLYPNPAVDYVILPGGISYGEVMDVSGRIVRRFSGNTGGMLDLRDLYPGLYVIKAQGTYEGGRIIYGRVIKAKP